MEGIPSPARAVGRGRVPPRETLPANESKARARTAAELTHGAVYTLEPDEEMVYASLVMDKWFLTGRDRLFSVAADGVVTEITEESHHLPELTLEAFRPEFRYMRRCPDDGAFDDWSHQEVH